MVIIVVRTSPTVPPVLLQSRGVLAGSEITLSPDGEYLLLHTCDRTHELDGGTWNLLLIRLKDLEVRQVKGIREEELYSLNRNSVYGLSDELMEWNSDLLKLHAKGAVSG